MFRLFLLANFLLISLAEANPRPSMEFLCQKLGGQWRSGTVALVNDIVSRADRTIAAAEPACAQGTGYMGAQRDVWCMPQVRIRELVKAYIESRMIWQCHVALLQDAQGRSTDDIRTARREGCAIQKKLDELWNRANGTGATLNRGPSHSDLLRTSGVGDLCADEAVTASKAKARKDGGENTPEGASSTNTETGITTTSVRNPDGTRTVTKTDKTGKVLSRETVGKRPTQASSTDTKTGITTTSVRNKDGTRTVTVTDKSGKILSNEIMGDEPTQASSTHVPSETTTTSVKNADGSRTVTKSDRLGR